MGSLEEVAGALGETVRGRARFVPHRGPLSPCPPTLLEAGSQGRLRSERRCLRGPAGLFANNGVPARQRPLAASAGPGKWEVSAPDCPGPCSPGGAGWGWGMWRGGAAALGARPLGAAAGGSSRAVESAAPAGGGCAPATAGYWPRARLAGGAGARGGGGVSGGTVTAQGASGPAVGAACAGWWICRCLAWVCARVWLRVCAGVCREWLCQSRGVLGLWPRQVCAAPSPCVCEGSLRACCRA